MKDLMSNILMTILIVGGFGAMIGCAYIAADTCDMANQSSAIETSNS